MSENVPSAVADELDVLFGKGQMVHQVLVNGHDALAASLRVLRLVRLRGGHLVRSELTTESSSFTMSCELTGLSSAGARALVCELAGLANVTLARLERHVVRPSNHNGLAS